MLNSSLFLLGKRKGKQRPESIHCPIRNKKLNKVQKVRGTYPLAWFRETIPARFATSLSAKFQTFTFSIHSLFFSSSISPSISSSSYLAKASLMLPV
ncbi:hypothetical protein LguiA_026886 [Lonicera macranthoides]